MQIFTLGQWVAHVATALAQHPGETAPQRVVRIRDITGGVARNNSSHSCRDGYLVRPINRMVFNVLIEVLAFARNAPPPGTFAGAIPADLEAALICEFNQGMRIAPAQGPGLPVCLVEPGRGSVGNHHAVWEMRHCPCFTTAAACVQNPAHGCQWTAQNACISRNARYDMGHAANDVGNMAGDWAPAPTTRTRIGKRYVPVPPAPGRYGRLFALPHAGLVFAPPPPSPSPPPLSPLSPSPPPPSPLSPSPPPPSSLSPPPLSPLSRSPPPLSPLTPSPPPRHRRSGTPVRRRARTPVRRRSRTPVRRRGHTPVRRRSRTPVQRRRSRSPDREGPWARTRARLRRPSQN
jgi:hypothetical protein